MTLAEKYGIQKGSRVEEINLGENPYKFEGTFKEFYELVAGGRVKALKQYGRVTGISVGGYDTIEADNLALEAFGKAYDGYKALQYLELANQLIEANLIPNIVSESPLRIEILNGLVTLDQYGNEVAKPKPNVERAPEMPEDECLEKGEYKVPGRVVDTEANIRNYIRKKEGKCLAKGCEISYTYDAQKDVYNVSGVAYGRKLTETERNQVKVDYKN